MLANGRDGGATGEVYVPRSPRLFEEVLAYVTDSAYPYPLELAFELDFYDVEYDRATLYDKERASRLLREQMDALHSKVMEQTRIIRFCNADILNIFLPFKCAKMDCTENTEKGELQCFIHEGLCLKPSCTTKSPVTNYCELHVDSGRYCISKHCVGTKMMGSQCCSFHSP